MSNRDCCDHCRLPLPKPWSWRGRSRATAVEPEGPRYCCLGCEIAAAISHDGSESGAARRTLTRLGLAVFFTMNVMAFTMALWTSDVYGADDPHRLAGVLQGLFRHLVLLFSAPVFLLLGGPLFENTWRELRRGVCSTDILLASGVAASFVYSTVSVLRGSGPIYFEVGCIVLVVVTLGRWLEASGKIQATNAIDAIAKLLPDQVRRVRGNVEELTPISELTIDDRIRVVPGERFPTDGRLVSNLAFVDEQALTGESRPVLKQPGDLVLGGSLNLDGDLIVAVTATGADGTLARLIELVGKARLSKGRYERLADRVSAWFFPAVALIALIAFGVHWRTSGLERGLLAGLSVVVIACPCALGLATPLAVWTALGRAAGEQVLFRSGEALERLAGVRAVRFDKTGTLTMGTPRLAEWLVEDERDRAEAIARASALAQSSTHALSQAIVRSVGPGSSVAATCAVRACAGLGIEGRIGDLPAWIYLGSRRFMDDRGQRIGPRLDEAARASGAQGRSVAFVGWDGTARGLFLFDELLRPSALPAVGALRAAGLDLAVLTGDHAGRGRAFAEEIGLPVAAELLPEAKVAAVREARARFGRVAMVGDGINDAPALAVSDVGVALGCGTDLSRDSAQVCLLGDDLSRLPWSIDLARRTVRVIRGNLFWAFGYNGIGVLCAAAGLLSPALAAVLMVGSSLLVITNTLQLAKVAPARERDRTPMPKVQADEPPRVRAAAESAA